MKAQAYLSGLNLYRGAVDGLDGPLTREAVIRYQIRYGLSVWRNRYTIAETYGSAIELFKYFAILVLGILTGSFYQVPYKYLLRYYYGEEYARYVYLCDSAMREHYIAKISFFKG